mgnify:CR=1 FL=1
MLELDVAAEMNALETVAVETKPVARIERGELELMIRREAFKRAQARQFRGGSPANDWFAAEAAVKAEGADRYYLPPPDIHFTGEGHRLVAEWLSGKLTP